MIYSMTGFGRATGVFEGKKITIEVKALNSKQLDISLKCPSYFRVKEMEIRKATANALKRGKIDINVFTESLGIDGKATINEELVKSYFDDLGKILNDLNLPLKSDLLDSILKLPEVLKSDKDEMSDAEWQFTSDLLDGVLKDVNSFRASEGESIESDLQSRVSNISEILSAVNEQDKARQPRIKQRIKQSLESIALESDFDENRFEQEMIYYLEKMDISEEKSRLASHCGYFSETMDGKAQGRKLSFISQEIGREINTIGSKANDAEIQKNVVLMKDELEKIKEQCANVL
ncbi:MAG: YicC family protein [Flavobacteriales bacterium]|nr:YicC family protein [Flavobacteriales bacterium]